MKKFLRKLLSLAALVLTVTNAWAESETVTSVATLASPSRLNNNTSYFNNSNFELNTWMNGDGVTQEGFFMPMHFNIAGVKNAVDAGRELLSAKLRLTHYRTNKGNTIGLRAIDGGWTEFAANRDKLKELVLAALESEELKESAITFAKSMSDDLDNSSLGDLTDYQVTIDLTDYVKGLIATDDAVDLLLYGKTNKKSQIWTLKASSENKGDSPYKDEGKWDALLSHFGFADDAALIQAVGPALVFELGEQGEVVVKAVQNETQFKGYDTLADALAEAQAGDVIVLNEDQEIADRTTFPSVTIKGAEDKEITITNKQGNKSAIINIANNTTLTFENLTLDAGGNKRSLFEASNASQAFVLKNVIIKNAGDAGNNEGVIHMKNGKVTLQDVTFKDCGNVICVRNNDGTQTLIGSVVFDNCAGANIYIGGQKVIVDASQLAEPATPITVDIIDELEAKAFITGSKTEYFSMLNTNYVLTQNEADVVIEPYVAPSYPIDCTDKVAVDGWKSDMGNVGDYTKDVAQKEQYLSNTTTLGEVLYQTVSGLDNGTYTVELYANASYTSGRGFESAAQDQEVGRTIVYAGDVQKTIPVVYQTAVGENNVVVLENVVVSNGTLPIGMKKIVEGSNWHTIQIKSLTQVSNQAEADAAAQDTYWKAIADSIVKNTAYNEFNTEEKTTLAAATNAVDVIAAIPAFYTAMKSFVSFVQAKNNVDLDIVKYASAEKKSALEALLAMPATANDAATQAAALPKAYRQYVESSALLEGVKGATVIAEAIKNPKAEEAIAEPWTVVLGEGSEGALTVLDAQPWTDGDDNAIHKYFDGGNWGAQSWNVTMQQQISLSAGKYQLTVKSRASQDVTTFVLFAGDAKTQMQTINDNGGVFGRGWNDASVEFELDKDCTITIGVQGITEKEHNWMSFSDFRLAMFYPIEATVVDDISAALNNNNDKVVYNVNGQKVTKTGRGLYIIRSAGNQGRKVFVR